MRQNRGWRGMGGRCRRVDLDVDYGYAEIGEVVSAGLDALYGHAVVLLHDLPQSTLANMSNSSFCSQFMMCYWKGMGFKPNTVGSSMTCSAVIWFTSSHLHSRRRCRWQHGRQRRPWRMELCRLPGSHVESYMQPFAAILLMPFIPSGSFTSGGFNPMSQQPNSSPRVQVHLRALQLSPPPLLPPPPNTQQWNTSKTGSG
jgi:hypothetical protein